jgi:hypothetical protein
MMTSASVVVGLVAEAVGAGVAVPRGASVDWHARGKNEARPAPSEREPKPRRERSMSSKESLSRMGRE